MEALLESSLIVGNGDDDKEETDFPHKPEKAPPPPPTVALADSVVRSAFQLWETEFAQNPPQQDLRLEGLPESPSDQLVTPIPVPPIKPGTKKGTGAPPPIFSGDRELVPDDDRPVPDGEDEHPHDRLVREIRMSGPDDDGEEGSGKGDAATTSGEIGGPGTDRETGHDDRTN